MGPGTHRPSDLVSRVTATLAVVDFDLPSDDDPRRLAVRRWLADNPAPSGRQLAEAGYVAPHWPSPWGIDADPEHQLIIDDELARAGVRRPSNTIGIGWAGPTILHAGSDEQKERYLFPLLAAEEIWCQLFSEPGAGSDLAGLSTRAERDGDEYVVNGQKIWTSFGHVAAFGILIARTDPDVAKHEGISYLICPMDAPGIEVRPIIEMTGGHTFNEVFFTDVRIPVENLVGEEHRGWNLAKVTLANERVSLSGGGALWGMGPTAGDVLDLVRASGGVDDPALRQRIAALHIDEEILRLIRMRTVSARLRGETPGPEASVRKILADEHGQRMMALVKDLTGAAGMLADQGPFGGDPGMWHFGYLFSQALTIGGGTGEVQRNIIAERVLGLPHDVDVEAGRSWREARTAAVSGGT
ncbi:MAG: acyl-CoA dehydrogenase family protein [Acidimicrobiia bacterium]|nr:acyl-CoA dehydrogenase family protein [Acidimicrobiia bacterium]